MRGLRKVMAAAAMIAIGSGFGATAQNFNLNENTNTNVNNSFARSNAAARSDATANSFSTSGSQSNSSVNITNAGRGSRTTRLVTPPAVLAPSLAAAGIETCLGSVSGGVSVMGGGFSFGTTTKDDDCNRRLYARQLHNMGYRGAAIAIQCLSPEVNYAMAVAGTPCVARPAQLAEGGAVVSAYAGLNSPAGTEPASGEVRWVPNPEYEAWQREQKQARRSRR